MNIPLLGDREPGFLLKEKINNVITKINLLKELDTENLITNGILIYDGEKIKTTNFTIENGFLNFNNYGLNGKTLTIVDNSLTLPFDGQTYTVLVNNNIESMDLNLPELPICSVCVVNFIYIDENRIIPTPTIIKWPNGILPSLVTRPNEVINLILWNDHLGNVYGECVDRKQAS